MKDIVENIKKFADKYGFAATETDAGAVLLCKNIDGRSISWIKYNQKEDTVALTGNTDDCNLWFYKTRPDLTPEKIIALTRDLNETLNLDAPFLVRNLIDPEDWQEIAHVCDATEDKRYMEN